MPNPCLQVLNVLKLFKIYKRDETLDRSISMRAAMCDPFRAGNAAGLYIKCSDPRSAPILHRGMSGWMVRWPRDLESKIAENYNHYLDQLVTSGLLERDGYWLGELKKGLLHTEGDIIRLWTGQFVSPIGNVAVHIGRAWNRRFHVDLLESVIPSGSPLYPLVLEIKSDLIAADEVPLDFELACLTPFRPNCQLKQMDVSERPDELRKVVDFYFPKADPSQPERRAAGKDELRYRTEMRERVPPTSPGGGECELLTVGRRNVVEVRTFERFITAGGWTADHPSKTDFQYVLLQNPYVGSLSWDGSMARRIKVDMPDPAVEEIRTAFAQLSLSTLDEWLYFMKPREGRHHDEYHLHVAPSVLFSTPFGWSSIIDSFAPMGMDGLRAVIQSDWFPEVAAALQFGNTGTFRLEKATPLLRIIPLPEELVWACHKESDWESTISARRGPSQQSSRIIDLVAS